MFVPKVIFCTPDVLWKANCLKFASPPELKTASCPFDVMIDDCLRTLAQPLIDAMSRRGSGCCVMIACAGFSVALRKLNVPLKLAIVESPPSAAG